MNEAASGATDTSTASAGPDNDRDGRVGSRAKGRAWLAAIASRVSGERLLFWLVVPVAIMLLAWQWQWPPLQPAPGFDESWAAGLAMALHNGLVFGQRVVFTYGPLGFLSVGSLWHVHLAQAAVAYTFVLRFAFALAVFASARRSFGAPIAFVVALVVAGVDALLLEPTVFLIAAVWALTNELSDRQAVGVSAAAGAFAGLESLNKVSVGASLVVLTAVFVLSVGERRRACVAAAAIGLAGSVLVLWVAAGQPVGALPDYVVNSARIAVGYGASVGIEAPGLGWEYPAAFVALGLGLWAAWQMTGTLRSRQRSGVLLLWVVFWFFAFKEGFVRHSPTHDVFFFGAMLGGFLAFQWRAWKRLAAVAGIAVLVVFALQAQTSALTDHLDLTRNVSTAFDQVRDVLSPSRRAALIAAGRAQIEAAEPLDPKALTLLHGHTVEIWPSEIALAWAYGLDWDPLPVMQSYNASTTALDKLDAAALASSHAPQRIVFLAGQDPDGRVTSFDEGLTSRAILCRYHELYATRTTAVLALGANRCSAPVLISTVKARWGQPVPIPPPPTAHSLVSVDIHGVDIRGLESIESFFYKPAARYVRLDNGRARRLVPGTASDGLPLRASRGVDYPAPFNVAVDAHTIAVLEQDAGASGGQSITYSFYAQLVTGGALANRSSSSTRSGPA